jgi:ABC-type amino acid transport substrate-binding protein
MKRWILLAFVLFANLQGFPANEDHAEKKVKVGVTLIPPYIFSVDGAYSGVCVDLWRMISDSLKLNSHFVYYPSAQVLLDDLKKGEIDVSICPQTITSERLHDFAIFLPFASTNTGIISRARETGPVLQVMKNLGSWEVIRAVLLVLTIVALFAVILWLAERKANGEHFHRGIRGIGDGMWWAIVTMTTVGYGDKIPKTRFGKVLSVLWMFSAIGMFFIVSGLVSSQLTVFTLQSEIINASDLSNTKVGTVLKSGYAETLQRNNIPHAVFNNPEEGFSAVSTGLIDTFVFDEEMLKYLIRTNNMSKNIRLVSSGLNIQFLCFMANKKNTGLVEIINPVLLNAIESQSWHNVLGRYQVSH